MRAHGPHHPKRFVNGEQGAMLISLNLLQGMYYSKECKNPDCRRKPDPNGKTFSSCAGCCKGVAYCSFVSIVLSQHKWISRIITTRTGSRKCQLHAWSLPSCPHKSICKSLRRISTHGPSSSPLRRSLAASMRSLYAIRSPENPSLAVTSWRCS